MILVVYYACCFLSLEIEIQFLCFLQRKTVRLVRVLWRHYGVEESTWEREDTMRATYPFLFRDEGTWFSRLTFK